MCIRIIRREMIHDTGRIMDNELFVRKNRWKDLYVPEGDKQKFIYLIGYPCEEDCGWEHPWRDRMKQRTEVAWKTYCAQMKHYQEVPDDTLPFLNIWTGTEIFAEALGCKVKKPEDNMPFAIPFVRSAHDLEKIRVPKLEDSSLMNLFEMADELKRRAGKDALMSLPDMQTPLDVVAQIWDKSDLFMAMIDEPEVVLELEEKVKNLQFAFIDEWFRRYGTEFIAHHPSYYMEKGITMSVDEIGSISTEMFDTFERDILNELSDRYGAIGIHSCSDSEHQWEKLAQVRNLKLLNLYRNGETIDRAFAFFSPICAHWHGIQENVPTAKPICLRNREDFPAGCRVVINGWAPSKKEAVELAKQFEERFRK